MADESGLFYRSVQVSAETPIKKLAWLIFILGKQKILNGGEDISEMAYLLYACLYWVIILCPSNVNCELIESKYPNSRLTNLLLYVI